MEIVVRELRVGGICYIEETRGDSLFLYHSFIQETFTERHVPGAMADTGNLKFGKL